MVIWIFPEEVAVSRTSDGCIFKAKSVFSLRKS